MKKKKTKEVTAAAVFAIKDTNEFLATLESWIVRKLPAWIPDIPPDDFEKLMRGLDDIGKGLEQPGMNPQSALDQMDQVLHHHLPAKSQPPNADNPLNYRERIFRAVYLFDSQTYNDGVETFFASTDESHFRLALEGLELVGATDLKRQLEELCSAVFGGTYPETEDARSKLCEKPTPTSTKKLHEFGRSYARSSRQLDELLAKWARDNQRWFG